MYSSDLRQNVPVTGLFDVTIRHFFRAIDYDTLQKLLASPQPSAVNTHQATATEALRQLCLEPASWEPDDSYQSILRHFIYEFQSHLQAGIEQRCRFAAQGSLEELLALILFETNPTVLARLFRNADMSLDMLKQLHTAWEERQTYPGDAANRDLLNVVIAEKQMRLRKLSEILTYAHRLENEEAIFGLLSYLPDRDEDIARGAGKALRRAHPPTLLELLHPAHTHWQTKEFDPLLCWRIAQSLEELLCLEDESHGQLKQARLALLEYAMLDLQQPKRFFTLIAAHVHYSEACRKMASTRLSIDELTSLMHDDTFPRRMTRQVLRVFRYHPDLPTRRIFADIANLLMEENRERLREMEQQIAALFDTINTSALMKSFDNDALIEFGSGDLAYLQEVIHQLLDLPGSLIESFGYRSMASAVARDSDAQKIQLFWRATIGQYLGRIRQIRQAVSQIWLKQQQAAGSPESFFEELVQNEQDVETHHKADVNCKLQISCASCLKRTCAAESYLLKISFLTEALLEGGADKTALKQERLP